LTVQWTPAERPKNFVTGNVPGTKPANSAYFPALDGIRAVAFLIIFLFHYLQLPWGWAGVDIFFVLSGFLITGILFDTRDDPHRVRNFYIRRTLRIFPLYYGTFLLILFAYPVFRWDWNWTWLAWPAYVGNWLRLFLTTTNGTHFSAVADAHLSSLRFPKVGLFLGHFWTLCIEEQFYLVWPWVIFGVRNRKHLLYACGACVLASPFLRVVAVRHLPPALINAGVTYWFAPFLLGALVALVRRGPRVGVMPLIARVVLVLLTTGVILFFIAEPAARPSFHDYVYPAWSTTWALSFIEVYSACLIVLALEYGTWTFRFFNLGPLRWLGRISYGAYVFHDIPHPIYTRIARHLWVHWELGMTLLAFAGTLLVSWASFRWFESRFLKMKDALTR
jgi:peptidoglycan/LPS O-acetylase OafA/YrhL